MALIHSTWDTFLIKVRQNCIFLVVHIIPLYSLWYLVTGWKMYLGTSKCKMLTSVKTNACKYRTDASSGFLKFWVVFFLWRLMGFSSVSPKQIKKSGNTAYTNGFITPELEFEDCDFSFCFLLHIFSTKNIPMETCNKNSSIFQS